MATYPEVDGGRRGITRARVEKAERRVAVLESAMRAALRHAEANGMAGWPVFVAMRKALG